MAGILRGVVQLGLYEVRTVRTDQRKDKIMTKTAADFDFGALKAKATETWQREGGREAKPVPENLLTALKASKAKDQAGLFSVPGAPYETVDGEQKLTGLARDLTNLLRRGANQLGYGLRLKVDASEDGKMSHVAFQATDKRAHDPSKPRKPTHRMDETDPEYAARLAAYERDLAAWQRDNRANGNTGQ